MGDLFSRLPNPVSLPWTVEGDQNEGEVPAAL